MSLGDFLKDKRIAKALTQTQVSHKWGYKSPQFLSNMELGRRTAPITVLFKLCEIYEVDRGEMRDAYLEEIRERAKITGLRKWMEYESQW